jgi:hypothetical protein
MASRLSLVVPPLVQVGGVSNKRLSAMESPSRSDVLAALRRTALPAPRSGSGPRAHGRASRAAGPQST